MKKNDKVILTIYIVLGIVLFVVGIITQMDYYSSLLVGIGFALVLNSIVQIGRFYYNTRPENVAAYNEKLRQQKIDIKDERKALLRSRAGYYTWMVTMVIFILASFIAALFRASTLIVCVLAGVAVAEYLIATIIYKCLCKRM